MSCNVVVNIDPSIKTYFWTDSSTVLAWIQREEQWKPFVWNRVAEIRKLTNKNNWFHISGEDNPADLPSRGCFGKKLADGRWWEGPSWLRKTFEERTVPNYECNEEDVSLERKKTVTSSLNDTNKEKFIWYYSYFSKYYKIVRLIGWIRRFANKCKRIACNNIDLTWSEFDSAEKCVIRLVQDEGFPQSVNDSKLSTLCPFIDDDGILRIQTKISDRKDEVNFRFRYVLPSQHDVVNRLIMSEHLRNSHAGVQCLMSTLRERFWIIKCRRTIKSVIRQCQVCRRYNAKTLDSVPIPLPIDRVRESAVFEVTGIDLAGPLSILESRR